MVAGGRTLFMRYGCSGCHGGRGTVRAPSLNGVYGSPVTLTDGSTVTADDRYLRDCILMPGTQRVASYDPGQPLFAGQLSEDRGTRVLLLEAGASSRPASLRSSRRRC